MVQQRRSWAMLNVKKWIEIRAQSNFDSMQIYRDCDIDCGNCKSLISKMRRNDKSASKGGLDRTSTPCKITVTLVVTAVIAISWSRKCSWRQRLRVEIKLGIERATAELLWRATSTNLSVHATAIFTEAFGNSWKLEANCASLNDFGLGKIAVVFVRRDPSTLWSISWFWTDPRR